MTARPEELLAEAKRRLASGNLGRPLGYLISSLMALIRDPIY